MDESERPQSVSALRVWLVLAGLALVALSGCGDSAEPDTSASTDDTRNDLINCESNIEDDVPVFYSTYFRCTSISLDGDTVVISGANLPPHLSYYYGEGSDQFEEFDYSRGDRYRPNPNEIAQRTFTIRIPLDPVPSGITIDSNTLNLTVGDGTDYPQGIAEIELYGVMCDGTIVMGANELDASAPEDALDLQAGHSHDIIDGNGNVLLEDRYHVHMASTIGVEPRGLTPEAQYYDSR